MNIIQQNNFKLPILIYILYLYTFVNKWIQLGATNTRQQMLRRKSKFNFINSFKTFEKKESVNNKI